MENPIYGKALTKTTSKIVKFSQQPLPTLSAKHMPLEHLLHKAPKKNPNHIPPEHPHIVEISETTESIQLLASECSSRIYKGEEELDELEEMLLED